MRLLIISHTPHYHQGELLLGWGPTVREIDYLASLFDEIIHLAPIYREPAPESAIPYSAPNVRFLPVLPAGGNNLPEKIRLLRIIPNYWRAIRHAMKMLDERDAVHVRCPANISLLALLYLARNRPVPIRWVKYAGNWQPQAAEPIWYKVQRILLRRNIHRGTVTINGTWANQPQHIHQFFNPCLTGEELDRGEQLAIAKQIAPPYRLLFVGRIEPQKGVDILLKVGQALDRKGVPFQMDLVGDGPEKDGYESWVQDQGLSQLIHFWGWKSKTEVLQFYARAHFLIFPSTTEGWPKVISEAMAFGVVPLASAISGIPRTFQDSGTGVALPQADVDAFVREILRLAHEPEKWRGFVEAGLAYAKNYTYTRYLDDVRDMFCQTWNAQLKDEEA